MDGSEFKASLGYKARPCLQKARQNKLEKHSYHINPESIKFWEFCLLKKLLINRAGKVVHCVVFAKDLSWIPSTQIRQPAQKLQFEGI